MDSYILEVFPYIALTVHRPYICKLLPRSDVWCLANGHCVPFRFGGSAPQELFKKERLSSLERQVAWGSQTTRLALGWSHSKHTQKTSLWFQGERFQKNHVHLDIIWYYASLILTSCTLRHTQLVLPFPFGWKLPQIQSSSSPLQRSSLPSDNQTWLAGKPWENGTPFRSKFSEATLHF